MTSKKEITKGDVVELLEKLTKWRSFENKIRVLYNIVPLDRVGKELIKEDYYPIKEISKIETNKREYTNSFGDDAIDYTIVSRYVAIKFEKYRWSVFPKLIEVRYILTEEYEDTGDDDYTLANIHTFITLEDVKEIEMDEKVLYRIIAVEICSRLYKEIGRVDPRFELISSIRKILVNIMDNCQLFGDIHKIVMTDGLVQAILIAKMLPWSTLYPRYIRMEKDKWGLYYLWYSTVEKELIGNLKEKAELIDNMVTDSPLNMFSTITLRYWVWEKFAEYIKEKMPELFERPMKIEDVYNTVYKDLISKLEEV